MHVSRTDRKWDHIRYALQNKHDKATAFEDIKFIHQSLPNISVSDVRIGHTIGGLSLSSPFFINAMTGGGGDKTYRINKELAIVAKNTGLAIAVGSQMSALNDKSERYTYEVVRKVNQDGIVIANLGSEATLENAKNAIDMIEANALQIHLNVIQELTMPEGDRDFSGAIKNIEAIVKAVDVPIIVKEVGFGMSKETVEKLLSIGVTAVDIGGTGGTNFAEIENERREKPFVFFHQWGIPTPISIIEAVTSSSKAPIIGSGGFISALDIAKGLALGADAIGLSGFFLRILMEKGINSLQEEIETMQKELILIMTALGARDIPELQNAPLVISGETYHWLNQRGIDTKQYSRRNIK